MGPSTDLTAGKSDFRSSPKADSNTRRPCNACEVLHLEIIGAAAGLGGTSYHNRLDVCRRSPGTEVLAFAKAKHCTCAAYNSAVRLVRSRGRTAAQPAASAWPRLAQPRPLQPRRRGARAGQWALVRNPRPVCGVSENGTGHSLREYEATIPPRGYCARDSRRLEGEHTHDKKP
jgi:hypothetical protein